MRRNHLIPLIPAFLFLHSFLLLANDLPRQKIVVIAHRAAHETAPENSLAAIKTAIELGCDYVELDVRKTKDGKLVLMHDSSVDRTSTGKGKVDQLTFDEIRKLTLKGPQGNLHPDEKVPTFEEALALCQGKIGLYLDHKAGNPQELLEVVRKYDMLKSTIVYSSLEKLREFKKLEPALWIMPDHPEDLTQMEAWAKDLHPETMDGGLHRWTKEQVETAHKLHVEVWVDILGPFDTEAGYKHGLELGVDAIQTDHPAAVLKFLKSRGRR